MRFKGATLCRGVGVRQTREIIVDFLLAESEFHRTALGRRRVIDGFGLSLPMVRPEDLLVLKALAGQPRDLANIGADEKVKREILERSVERLKHEAAALQARIEALEQRLGE